jgi:hypothetical protein
MTAPDLLRLAIGCPQADALLLRGSLPCLYVRPPRTLRMRVEKRPPHQHNLRKWDGYPAASLNAGPRVWWFWGKSGSGHLRPRSDVSDLKKLALSENRSSPITPFRIGQLFRDHWQFPASQHQIPCSANINSLFSSKEFPASHLGNFSASLWI